MTKYKFGDEVPKAEGKPFYEWGVEGLTDKQLKEVEKLTKFTKVIKRGHRFGIAMRDTKWGERTFIQKVLFWRKYRTPKNLITDEMLHKLIDHEQ